MVVSAPFQPRFRARALTVLLLVAAFLMGGAVQASAASSYFASPTGRGNSCTAQRPCSLSVGLGKVGAGDTLYLRGGSYNQVVSFDKGGTSDSSRITIAGYPGEKAVIDGRNTVPSTCYSYLVALRGSYVTLRDLTVTNSYGSGIFVGGTKSHVLNVTLANTGESGLVFAGTDNIADGVTVTGNGNRYGNGCSTWGAALDTIGVRTTIRNSVSYDNVGEGISVRNGATGAVVEDNISYDNRSNGIYLNSTTNALVQRNLVYYTPDNPWGKASSCIVIGKENTTAPAGLRIVNNLTAGCWLSLMSDSNVTALTDVTIAHNTFTSTTKTATDISRGYNMNVYFRPSLVSFTNSVFQNNIVLEEDTRQVPISLPATHPGFALSHNLWSTAPVSAARGTGDVIADPELAATSTLTPGGLDPDHFHLTPTSPAIDRALTLPTITEDYYRTPRPTGPTPDIGAHEYR